MENETAGSWNAWTKLIPGTMFRYYLYYAVKEDIEFAELSVEASKSLKI